MLQTTILTNTSAASALGGIDFSKPSWDVFIIVFFVIAAFLYGMSLGRDRIIVILVSIYMALAIVNTAPFLPELSVGVAVNGSVLFKVSTFLGAFIFLFFLLSRSALLRTVASGDTQGNWLQVVVFSILHVGLLISVTLTFLPQDMVLDKLAPLTQTIFVGEWARFLWVILPVVAMAMLKGGSSNDKKYKYDI